MSAATRVGSATQGFGETSETEKLLEKDSRMPVARRCMCIADVPALIKAEEVLRLRLRQDSWPSATDNSARRGKSVLKLQQPIQGRGDSARGLETFGLYGVYWSLFVSKLVGTKLP